MKINIAGAGAGKTTTMADTIVNLQSEVDSHLNIFCITFTNNAVACIERKLKERYGELPDNIIVSTTFVFVPRVYKAILLFALWKTVRADIDIRASAKSGL